MRLLVFEMSKVGFERQKMKKKAPSRKEIKKMDLILRRRSSSEGSRGRSFLL